MPVRPESYKIVMILFYLLLCTKYLFQQHFAKEKIFAIAVEIKVARYQAQKKYRHHKNIGFDKIAAEIKVVRYQAQKKYWHRKNIGFDKIALKLRWRVIKRRKNNGFTKISVLTK
jgi:hypothetical protein